jgi:hypothetical protein
MINKFLKIKFQNRLVNKWLLQYFLIKKYFGRFSKNNFCRESEISICLHLVIYVNIREKCSSSDVFISSTCRIQQIQVWFKKIKYRCPFWLLGIRLDRFAPDSWSWKFRKGRPAQSERHEEVECCESHLWKICKSCSVFQHWRKNWTILVITKLSLKKYSDLIHFFKYVYAVYLKECYVAFNLWKVQNLYASTATK